MCSIHPTVTRLMQIYPGHSSATTQRGMIRAIIAHRRDLEVRIMHAARTSGTVGGQWSLDRLPMAGLSPDAIATGHGYRYRRALAAIVAGARPMPRKGELRRAAIAAKKAAKRAAADKSATDAIAAAALAAWPLRRATSSWAGGHHDVVVTYAATPREIGGSCDTSTAWSSNGTWSGNDSCARLCVSRTITPANIVEAGIVHIARETVSPGIERATWLEQSRGVSVRCVDGWIVRGYHVAGGSMERAISVEAASRKRAHIAGLVAARRAEITALANDRRWLMFADSIRGGNCDAGTRAAAEQISRVIGVPLDDLLAGCAVRADVVARALPESSMFIARAMTAAAAAGH